MRTMRSSASLAALAALVLAYAAASCGDSSGPGPAGPPASVLIVSGNAQDGIVGTELSKAVVVKVVDAGGRPVAGQVVNFRVTAGGGAVFAGASSTNAQGIAQERWTLGTKAGDPQKLEVRAVDNITGEPIVFATFTATARAAAPATAAILGGDGQTDAAGAGLAQAVAVKVTDRYDNPVPGVTVAWAVTGGGGSVSSATSTTDTDGVARMTWTLGTALGANGLSATVQGLPAVSFSATATAAGPASIQLVSGGGQSATVGSVLPRTIVVRVADRFGNSVSGATVMFAAASGSGSFLQSTETTDSQGQAGANWRLGSTPGTQTGTITVAGVATPLTVSATATVGPPSRVTIVSGDQQVGVASQLLAQPLVVRVTDSLGNAIAGQTVSWTISSGCGTVSPTTSTSDATGAAQAQWTLGGSAAACGTGGVRAAIAGGASATFKATITGAGAGAISAATNLSDFVGVIGAPTELTAFVGDAARNPVPGVTVTWSLAAGTGTLSAASSVTDATGRATVWFTPGTVAGNNFIDARTPGAGSTRFLVWTRSAAPARIVIRSGDGQAGPIGQPLADSISVRVEDQYGNGVYGEPVQFEAAAGTGYTQRGGVTTDTMGIIGARWIPGVVGANAATATWNGQSVTFRATGTTGARKSIIVVSGNDQEIAPTTLPPGRASTPQPIVVKVIDAQGGAIVGETVTWLAIGTNAATTTDSTGQTRLRPTVDNSLSVVDYVTLRLASGEQTQVQVFIVGPGGNPACYPMSGGGQSARIGTRLAEPIIVKCFGRSGATLLGRVALTGFNGLGSGGTAVPLPGYRRAGEYAFYWVMPAQPGTWYFYTYPGANFTTATATP